MTHANGFQGWIATLNTGEEVRENPQYTNSPGELSSWQQLLIRLQADNLSIVSLRLHRAGSIVHAMNKKAGGYLQAYQRHSALNGKGTFTLQGIGTIMGEAVFITWVNCDTGEVFQDVCPVKDMWVHSDRRVFNDLYRPGG